MDEEIEIEIWDESHARWEALRSLVTDREASPYVMLDDDETLPFFAGVALTLTEEIVGYHVCLVQPIGPEMGISPVADRWGNLLRETKVRGLRVEEAWRGRGLGTQLQLATLEESARRGCFQMRSRSNVKCVENYHIKMKLGFACHPDVRTLGDGSKAEGVYWVKRV